MKLGVYSVYDSKAEAYLQPFYMQSEGQAIRSFGEVANNKEHSIGKYPEDFTLFHLGYFDDSTCDFELLKTQVALRKAIELVRSV